MAGIAVLGTGAWGTALARLLAMEHARQAGELDPLPVALWDHHADRAVRMAQARENVDYLPGFSFPRHLLVTGNLAEAVSDREVVLVVTPSQKVREQAAAIASLLSPGAIVVSASKGIELHTKLRPTQVIAEELPQGTPIATLSGPNLAVEVAKGLPAAAVVASRDPAAAERVRALVTAPRFRVYVSDDPVGVELGGALKNIVALGVGISDGLGYGDNAKASFMTRSLAEIARVALAAGANPMTLAGLSGLGDLIATCSSPLSRNRTLGLALAEGRNLDEVLAERKSVAEGVTTTQAALELAESLGVEMPVTREIARVLFEGKDVTEAVTDLMLREPRHELHGFGDGGSQDE